MKKIVLYIAQSLDGYIATKDGSVAWLDDYFSEEFETEKFIEGIDTVIQGNTTYEQFKTKYPGKNCYVFSKDADILAEDGVTLVKGDVKKFIDNLDEKTHKNIWVVGGSNIISQFLDEQLVDEIMIYVMPIFLGGGIPLFVDFKVTPRIMLKSTKQFSNGVVELYYTVKK